MWRRISLLILISIADISIAQQTCSSCFESSGLKWCTNKVDLNTTMFSRCLMDESQSTEWDKWCGLEFVYNPVNTVNVEEDKPFSDPGSKPQEKLVQIKPQIVDLKLTPGKEEVLPVHFKYVQGYSLELYYLMDMSKSMEQDKETIVQLADDLANELKELTPDLKLGFGSFLDKVLLPYVNTHSSWLENPCKEEVQSCRAPYGYQNIVSLTNDTDRFIESVNNAKLSTNWDDPEGGLDGLMQAMLCDDIGWQTSSTRHLIVYVSGSAFKYAGDGLLAGLTRQNDMQCHLDEEGSYTYSSKQDYPSISQIENISKKERMHVIFAVKGNVLPLYESLSQLITQSEASELRDDSSNIIDIITSIYEDISKTLTLTDDSYKSPGLSVSYASKCGSNAEWTEGSAECDDVDVNEEIQYQIKFKLSKCFENGETATVRITPLGLEDELVVKVSTICECECEKKENSIENSFRCSMNGRLACGVCHCYDNFSGENCECEIDGASSLVTRDECKRPGDEIGSDCSGHGVCKCGVCDCKKGVQDNPAWVYQGTYCECSNFDCPKSSGLLCSGHGRCQCSQCICESGWSGESCSCDIREDNCINPVNQKICSGHGSCHCNQCRCNAIEGQNYKTYFGKFCEDCETCEGRCSIYNDCIKCQIYNTGPLMENCDEQCSELEIILVDEIEDIESMKRCSYKSKGCLIISAYNSSIEKIVLVQKEPNCSGKIKIYVVIGSIVALILLVGLILLIIWKCWVTIKDNREYKKFIKEYEQANYSHQMNPIYRDPITRVTNPLREMGGYEE